MLRVQCHGAFHSRTMSHEICTACRCGSTLEHRPISISYRTNYHILYFELEISSFSQHFIHLLLIMLLRFGCNSRANYHWNVRLSTGAICQCRKWLGIIQIWDYHLLLLLFLWKMTILPSFACSEWAMCFFFKYNLHWFQFPRGMYIWGRLLRSTEIQREGLGKVLVQVNCLAYPNVEPSHRLAHALLILNHKKLNIKSVITSICSTSPPSHSARHYWHTHTRAPH